MLEDRLYPFLRTYEALPSPLAVVIGSLYRHLPNGFKFGRSHEAYRRLLEETETWDAASLEQHQWAAVQKTIRYAAGKVPWYGRAWAEHGVRVSQVTSPADFATLPFVTKQDVRDHAQEFVSVDARPRDILPLTTSGSTGEPLRLLYARGLTRGREHAFIEHMWRRVGYSTGSRLAVLRGSLVRGRAQGRLWRRDATRNRWVFSTVDMTSANCQAILTGLQRVRPEFLHVYPSALTTLCKFMLRQGKAGSLPSLRAVLSGSENLYPWQHELITQALGESVEVLRWYGLAEQVSLAGSCELSQDYHVFPHYSYTELVRDDGIRADVPGEDCEIIGTTFDNWIMPLIRYRTADGARLGPSSCRCGRPYQLMEEVLGRVQNWAITAIGDRIPFAANLFGMHGQTLIAVRHWQLVQGERGVLDLWVVPWRGSSRGEVRALVGEFERRLVPTFEVRSHAVQTIEELPQGKREYFVQQMEDPDASQR